MKKFIRDIGILFLSTIIVLFVLDWLYTYTYKNGIPRNKIAYILSIKNEQIDYIFLGSSRVDNMIDPSIITSITGKKALNLGIQGAKPDDYLLMLKLIELQNIKTDTIFIQMDYVYNFGKNSPSEIVMSSLMPYLDIPEIASNVKERNPDYAALRHVPFYRYLVYDYKLGFREFFNTNTGRKPKVDLDNGYNAKYGTVSKKLRGTLPSKIKESNETVEKIHTFAQENKLKIVYFMSPFCPETKNSDFSEKLKKRIPDLIDYSRIFNDHENYFFNCSHLNDTGAKEFSKRFAQDLLHHKN